MRRQSRGRVATGPKMAGGPSCEGGSSPVGVVMGQRCINLLVLGTRPGRSVAGVTEQSFSRERKNNKHKHFGAGRCLGQTGKAHKHKLSWSG